MEGTSFSKLTLLISRCILIASLIQLNYAEVCYIRSHMGYGGCIRWFLPAKQVSNCTSIKLGGYTNAFYKRNQIIEFDQPFISEISEDIQNFLKNRVPSIAPSHDKTTGNSGQYVSLGENNTDHTMQTESVSQTTVFPSIAPSHDKTTGDSGQYATLGENNSDKMETESVSQVTSETNQSQVASTPNNMGDDGSNTPSPTQSSTYHVPSTTVDICPNLTCPGNMNSREISLTETIELGWYNDSSKETLRKCGSRKIVACGCDSNDGSFFPIGVSYKEGSMYRCDKNGSLVRYLNIDVGNTVCGNLDDDILFFSKMDSEGKSSMIGLPTDCHDLYEAGFKENGIYCVFPKGLYEASSIVVRCDMGAWPMKGWTVIQRRVNGSVQFDRNWTEYKNGFGNLNHEFWIGNENIYRLTYQTDMGLRIDITNDDGKYYAIYDLFRVGSGKTRYRLIELGNFKHHSGIDNDALRYHANAFFSTKDYDEDQGENCAKKHQGGWWFTQCYVCYLNGVYGKSEAPGSRWYGLNGGQYNIKGTEMKIQPVN